MFRYFDNTFFKFFFGFLAILFVSFVFLFLTRYFEKDPMPESSSYVEAQQAGNHN
jgi:hypothetical protein